MKLPYSWVLAGFHVHSITESKCLCTMMAICPSPHVPLRIHTSLMKQPPFLSCFVANLFFLLQKLSPSFPQGHGHHQVESHIRKKLDSLLKESRIGDKEDTDSFSIRALLRATHQGLQKNLRQVPP